MKKNLWHGYTQDKDASPGCPPPEAKVGQVWVWPKHPTRKEMEITAVCEVTYASGSQGIMACTALGLAAVFGHSPESAFGTALFDLETQWPPEGAVLVKGEGAP